MIRLSWRFTPCQQEGTSSADGSKLAKPACRRRAGQGYALSSSRQPA